MVQENVPKRRPFSLLRWYPKENAAVNLLTKGHAKRNHSLTSRLKMCCDSTPSSRFLHDSLRTHSHNKPYVDFSPFQKTKFD
ncbi:hypothetical protein YC2023_086106 [Brassica napus]